MRIQVQKALELAREKFPRGGEVTLAVYPDEESFTALRNPDGMRFSEHRKIVSETAAALVEEGYRVKLVEISQVEYFHWLGEELNTTKTRAQFVALKTGGKHDGNFAEIPQCGRL